MFSLAGRDWIAFDMVKSVCWVLNYLGPGLDSNTFILKVWDPSMQVESIFESRLNTRIG